MKRKEKHYLRPNRVYLPFILDMLNSWYVELWLMMVLLQGLVNLVQLVSESVFIL